MAVATYPAIMRNGKIELVAPQYVPDDSEVYVVVSEIVTEKEARRQANGWLISEVGNMLMAKNGILVQVEQGWVWRFDVFITAVSHEPWGPIGRVDVNAVACTIIDAEQTKEMLYVHGRTYQRTV